MSYFPTPPSPFIISYILRGHLHYEGGLLNLASHVHTHSFPVSLYCGVLWIDGRLRCTLVVSGHVMDIYGESCELYYPLVVDLIMV